MGMGAPWEYMCEAKINTAVPVHYSMNSITLSFLSQISQPVALCVHYLSVVSMMSLAISAMVAELMSITNRFTQLKAPVK
jgi:hypothetical protein